MSALPFFAGDTKTISLREDKLRTNTYGDNGERHDATQRGGTREEPAVENRRGPPERFYSLSPVNTRL